MKNWIYLVEKGSKVYVKPGQKPPHGESTGTGPRGGIYYEPRPVPAQSSQPATTRVPEPHKEPSNMIEDESDLKPVYDERNDFENQVTRLDDVYMFMEGQFKNRILQARREIEEDDDFNEDLFDTVIESLRMESQTEDMIAIDQMKYPEREPHFVTVGDPEDPRGIGYMYYDESNSRVYIHSIVNSDPRVPGVGKRVINYAKNLAKEKGINHISLKYTDSSKAYYENNGFDVDGKDNIAWLEF
jgi:N-acetylglutamate synthase-like GNAT family acetyltransferase